MASSSKCLRASTTRGETSPTSGRFERANGVAARHIAIRKGAGPVVVQVTPVASWKILGDLSDAVILWQLGTVVIP